MLIVVVFPVLNENNIPIYSSLKEPKTKRQAIFNGVLYVIYTIFPVKIIVCIIIWCFIKPIKKITQHYNNLPATKRDEKELKKIAKEKEWQKDYKKALKELELIL